MTPKSRPILFSAPMVRAILNGSKTQTRRIVKPQPDETSGFSQGPIKCQWYHPTKIDRHGEAYPGEKVFGFANEDNGWPCPYGVPGERLWVRETFARIHPALLSHLDPEEDNGGNNGWSTVFRADGIPFNWKDYGVKWTPSIFMPRRLIRITLEITEIRVERLQDISESDAIAEGCEMDSDGMPKEQPHPKCGMIGWDSAVEWYSDLWESINGKGSRAKNPRVWVITFRRWI